MQRTQPRTLVAYVSGHGLGHSTREIEILRRLPPEIPLIVKTAAPEWFWHAELPRPFTWIPESFDVGCIQRNGLEIDIAGTLATWKTIDSANQKRFAGEQAFLEQENVALIVSDVPSFPLTVAASLGIPAVCIANFTWADIYRPFAAEQPEFGEIADRLQAEYQQATLHLEAGFSLPMTYFPRTESIGIVARAGRSHRDLLLSLLPESARTQRIALVYVGGWGLPVDYLKTAEIAGWHFISLDPPPQTLPNWSVLDRTLLAHPDIVASVDAVLSKPGYGIAGECLCTGTPLLYPPREEFAEYAPLHAQLSAWQGGITLPLADFLAGEWSPYLNGLPLPGVIVPQATNGGIIAAQILTRLFEERGGGT